jgi:hypothetical protein
VLPVNGEGSAEQSFADPDSRFTRGRLAFRRWRRTRPFWGGLFLLLSGLEFYVSAHMDLLPLKVAFGYQGFLSWLIPLVLLLCGVLTWLTPAQRTFYGIIGAVTSVASLIALNLGGFFVGMLLGMVGGALAVAWAPLAPPPVEKAEPAEDVETTQALPMTGPLTDELPTSETSPLGVPPVQGGRHAAEPPDSRLLTLLVLVAVVTAALLALPQPTPAAAAPCGASPPGGTGPKPPPPSASPSASASPSPTGGGNLLSDLFTSMGKLLGVGQPSAAPAAAPAPPPAAAPKAPAAVPSTTRPAPCPPSSARGGKTSGRARTLAVPADQPLVNKVPSKQISALLGETGVRFDGVVDLPVQDGTIRALQFTLDSATSTPFELQVPTPNGTLSLKSAKLTVSGNVTFFASRIKGFAGGVLPVDYTPDSPPLFVPPIIFFTSATVDLVFVHCDLLTAPSLSIGYL